MTTENELERNVGYVTNILTKGPNEIGYSLFVLTLKVRIAHDKHNPLGLKDARDAINEAERRGLIRKFEEDTYILNK